MTKYKLNNNLRSATEVTLTSYMPGSADSKREREREEKRDSNQNESSNPASAPAPASAPCELCPHSCEFLKQSDRLAASLAKSECDKFGLNELKVESLDKEVCLCEKYNGGCKLCPRRPRAGIEPAMLAPAPPGKGCHGCHDNTCSTIYPSKIIIITLYSKTLRHELSNPPSQKF